MSFEPADNSGELVSFTSSSMGGVRFSVDPDHFLFTPGDNIVVSVTDPADKAGWETASIGLITQSADGQRIDSVDEVIRLTADTPTAEVTPTDTVLELFGYELDGYRIRADVSQRDVLLYAADRYGAPPMGLFSFFPNAEIFLAETPAGVLMATRGEADEEENLDAISPALGTLLSTIELIGPGFEQALPDGQAIEPTDGVSEAARGTIDEDGPAPLDTLFSPVEAGTYQLANFGRTFTLDFDDGWLVQPNFPGFIVLTAPGSGGPGDRVLVFLSGVTELVPIIGGPVESGARIAIDSADDLINGNLEGIDIDNVQEVDLGGVAATRFDLAISPDQACTVTESCEYAVVTSSGVVQQIESTQIHRIWWIDDGVGGPSMIVAMSTLPLELPGEWIETATELLDTINFP